MVSATILGSSGTPPVPRRRPKRFTFDHRSAHGPTTRQKHDVAQAGAANLGARELFIEWDARQDSRPAEPRQE